MQTILLFGAGKSATVLIDYLLEHSILEDWKLIVVDADLALAQSKTNHSSRAAAISFDINNDDERSNHIRNADIVISLLPPTLHYLVAMDCLKYGKNLLTASYVDEKIRNLQADIESRGLLFLCEMGLDPGIDHMSAMNIIDAIHQQGGYINSFRSHCGGLVAPESDNNPWHYKISWNPKSIVLAGKAGAHFKEDGIEKRLQYQELFSTERMIEIPDLGLICWFPNWY
jgi:saccharopine dehydrogenase-like NADP-dependent oxidoreductase